MQEKPLPSRRGFWYHEHMLQPQGEFVWFFFVPAVVFGLLTAGFTIRNLKMIFASTRAVGTLIGYESVEDNEGKTMSAQKVAFIDKQGVRRETFARVRSNPPSGNPGDQVTVYYNPVDPAQATVGTFMELWLHVTIFAVLFGIFFIIWFGILMGPKGQVHG